MTLRVVLMLCIPVALTLTNVRLLMTPLFPDIEYNVPGFPPDPYGFTKEDRLYWAKRSVDYILGATAVDEIAQWRFTDNPRKGAQRVAPSESWSDYSDTFGDRDVRYFYNDREVKHMIDVRAVTGFVIIAWVLSTLLVILSVVGLVVSGQVQAVRWGLLGGAIATCIVLGALIVFILTGFDFFFTAFHQVFFESGTWMFRFSDSLIRLFPLPFWNHAFMFVGVATLTEAVGLAILAWYGLKF